MLSSAHGQIPDTRQKLLYLTHAHTPIPILIHISYPNYFWHYLASAHALETSSPRQPITLTSMMRQAPSRCEIHPE